MEIDDDFDEIDGLLKEYRSLQISDAINYALFNRIAITFHSTALEGSSLTQVETEVLIESGYPAKDKPLNHNNMAKDHYDALVFACKETKENRPITPKIIQEINARAMKCTGWGKIGSLRKEYEVVGEDTYLSYKKIPALLNKLCIKANYPNKGDATDNLALISSFVAHYQLVAIHPFPDGNGRTARILMNYIQAINNLPMGPVFNDTKAEYIEALNKYRKLDDKGYAVERVEDYWPFINL